MENDHEIERLYNELNFLPVRMADEDDFLKIKETLSRIGIASNKTNTLYQTCHILHKRGHYFIVHFKELFLLDGKTSSIDETDLQRRNAIYKLICDWGLAIPLVDPESLECGEALKSLKIIKYHEKSKWNLETKYSIGRG